MKINVSRANPKDLEDGKNLLSEFDRQNNNQVEEKYDVLYEHHISPFAQV